MRASRLSAPVVCAGYARGKALLEKCGNSTPEIESVISKLADIPVDITPVFVAAGEQ